MYCRDCLFRNEEKSCDSPYFSDYKNPEERGLTYSYSEGGSFTVGDFFGCVHFESK